jgi:hypothetical protein
MILLACRGHGTSNIFCSSDTQLVVCAFLQPILGVGLSSWGKGSTGTGTEARELVSRQLEWCIDGMRQKVDRKARVASWRATPVVAVGSKVPAEAVAVHLKTLLHWFAHNYITEFDGIVLPCKYYSLHIIFRKNYARDTSVI